jgi:dipeptidyl aminopeptidase/acylaminoacyl peptidase
MRLLLVIASCSMLLVFSAVAGASEPWTVEKMMDVKTIGNVQVSPDGEKVHFTVTRPVMTDEKSEYLTQIFLARTGGSGSVQLTRGEKSSTNPCWSPDGRQIAFTSSRSGKNNIWIIPTDGGEARRLTDLKMGVNRFRWSPDGSRIAFVSTDGKTDEEEKKSKGKDDARLVGHDKKMNHLWVVSVKCASGEFAQPRRLTEGNFSVGGFGWSADCRTIAFSHTPEPGSDHWPKSDISTVEVETGSVSGLLTSGAAEVSPVYSPDGKWLAFVKSEDPATWASTNDVYAINLSNGSTQPLARTFDRQPGIIGWSAESNGLYCSESRGTLTRIFNLPLDGKQPEYLDIGERVAGSISLNFPATHLGLTLQSTKTPVEVFTSALKKFSPVKQCNVNSGLSSDGLGRTETVNWKSRDGLAVEGLLTYPVGYEKGRSYPLLLVIHGGPTGVFRQGYIASQSVYPVAAFAAEGFAILRCNIRGSSGYGREFRYANYGDWGGMDYQDLMTGVDHLIDIGLADPERLGVMGWSYGGYMTSWIISQTKRFKAASIGAPVTNLMSFTGTTDIPSFIPDYFGTEFWEDPAPYRDHSAMFKISGATTPSLIQHGEKDIRVPFGQSLELYNALKRQNVEVEMVAYPREGHGLGEPKHRLDCALRNMDWFKRHLNNNR